MVVLHVQPKLQDGAWADLREKVERDPMAVVNAIETTIGGIERGMQSGAPSVMIRVETPDGRTVIAETSLKLFLTAADALRAALGDPR